MVNCGVCCANLKDNKTLMKMGLALVLVGHVNFLLGALVHGAVLRHISVHTEARILVYAIANVIAIVAGLMKWVLLVFSFIAGLLAIASTLGLIASVITAIVQKGQSLMTHCTLLKHGVDSSSITYECPFDPTRIYSTTIILWVPLILTSVVEMVFSFRCFAACTSFLYLCPCRRKPTIAKRVRIQRAAAIAQSPPSEVPPELDTEAMEQDELLDSSAVVEQSHWL
ncbi:transmembrane protein 54a isoform X2 [Syngnathus typhle]|uniref:transmembrane protein 54a isoform X2 n=1 Tax=Syngnathus typhle TaxID=161592 RepID=UPI002A69E67C|nr:transmembrane protein 54a isoform X2 [Syngnathus typhle]